MNLNFGIIILGIYFWFLETSYFGWNFRASSEAEIICDGIAILIVALGLRK